MSRADEIYIQTCRQILDHGVWDTDRPVRPHWEDGTPAHTIKQFCVVNRYDLRQGYQCDMTQAVTVLQAIRCCTYNAAYQSYEEKIKGSIEVGKLADLIICDRDILAIDTHELHDVKVDLTMIDGKVEYQRA